MKFTVKTKEFLSHIQIAGHFTSSLLSTHPSLQGIYLKTGKDMLNIKSTNINDFFETSISVQINQEGECIIDGKKLIEFCSLLSEDEITLELKNTMLVIATKQTKGVFHTYLLEDYPETPHSEGTYHPISDTLKNVLPLVLFSASKDESKPVLTATYMNSTESETHVVTTDGFRLSLLSIPEKLFDEPCLIPSRLLVECIPLLKESKSSSIAYLPESKCIAIAIDNKKIVSRVIEGDFPPYKKVIPQQAITTIRVERISLLKKIKLTSIFARELSNIIIMTTAKEGLVIQSKGMGTDIPSSTQEYITFEGEPMKCAFNYRFVLDFLNNVESAEIEIQSGGQGSPVVFKPVGTTNTFVHIIMPLRTEETE